MQPSKALLSIIVIDEGINTFISDVHFLKAALLIFVTEDGIIISTNESNSFEGYIKNAYHLYYIGVRFFPLLKIWR